MPQMSPSMWLILMIFFLSNYLLTMMFIYFQWFPWSFKFKYMNFYYNFNLNW